MFKSSFGLFGFWSSFKKRYTPDLKKKTVSITVHLASWLLGFWAFGLLGFWVSFKMRCPDLLKDVYV